jgi:alkanesulfonate monooxygenase SsuD/methylene tetrahydromethanopterin reductase-like flavin-dependent oxidoreductase (luciferase family)
MTARVPLSILDLSPIPSGATPADALRQTVDLAQRAEGFGYLRYWFAEHHLNPGVVSASPAIMSAIVAGATQRIRVGSGAVLLANHTPISVVEQFGTIASLYPGRVDLGLGRSPRLRDLKERAARPRPTPPPGSNPAGTVTPPRTARTVNGLLIPPRPPVRFDAPRFKVQAQLLQPGDGPAAPYTEQVAEILAFLDGTYRSNDGFEAHVLPGEGTDMEVWILGTSPGESAELAGRHGLRFAGSYHLTPGTVLETVDAYRQAFQPSAALDRPHVMVSADVVVAEDDETARLRANGYGLWVLSIRCGDGAIPYPSPEDAAAHRWTDDERLAVADRVDTQIVGSPATVVDKLEVLRQATGADELLITTITHDHADRVRSYQLLADAWPA